MIFLQVKVAQVRATPKIGENPTKENDIFEAENGKFHGKENESVFKRWLSAPPSHYQEHDKRKKRNHKNS